MDTITITQHYVAEAILAIHQQLSACFRGDSEGARETRKRAEHFTCEAVKSAKKLKFEDPVLFKEE